MGMDLEPFVEQRGSAHHSDPTHASFPAHNQSGGMLIELDMPNLELADLAHMAAAFVERFNQRAVSTDVGLLSHSPDVDFCEEFFRRLCRLEA